MPRPCLYATRAEKDAAYYERKKARQQYPSLPPGPYRILYADPPWKYYSTDPIYHGHAKDKYPLLKISELCALPVRKLVAPKAVLFLWVTNPILPECFPVIKAWGFTYKNPSCLYRLM
jgi:N6-adenosine-specific RNA methylase IME4